MAYLYHVTTEENAKSILKNGLIPKIGERSQLVGETEKYVYLCGRKDVPFWSLILDKPVVLRVEMKDGEVDENNVYQYSYYIIRKLWQKLQSLLKGYEKAGSQEV